MSIRVADLEQLPVPELDLGNPTAKGKHDQLVKLVEQMLLAKLRFAKSKIDRNKNYYESKCAALDRRIDAAVYEMYGLTEKEIRIVETSGP